MSERTATLAFRRCQALLQMVASCVSDAVVILSVDPAGPGKLTTSRFRVRGNASLGLRLEENLVSVPNGSRFDAEASAYRYTIQAQTGPEVLSWHLHPERGPVRFPHMHLGAGLGQLNSEAHRAHFPTGAIRSSAVVRFLIRDFGVRPRRPDWEAVLAATERP